MRIHTLPTHCQQKNRMYLTAFFSGQKRIFLGLSLSTSLQAEFSPRYARSYLESEHPSPPPHPSPLSPQGRTLLPPLSKRPMFVVGVHPTPPPPPTPTKLFLSARRAIDFFGASLPPSSEDGVSESCILLLLLLRRRSTPFGPHADSCMRPELGSTSNALLWMRRLKRVGR